MIYNNNSKNRYHILKYINNYLFTNKQYILNLCLDNGDNGNWSYVTD